MYSKTACWERPQSGSFETYETRFLDSVGSTSILVKSWNRHVILLDPSILCRGWRLRTLDRVWVISLSDHYVGVDSKDKIQILANTLERSTDITCRSKLSVMIEGSFQRKQSLVCLWIWSNLVGGRLPSKRGYRVLFFTGRCVVLSDDSDIKEGGIQVWVLRYEKFM